MMTTDEKIAYITAPIINRAPDAPTAARGIVEAGFCSPLAVDDGLAELWELTAPYAHAVNADRRSVVLKWKPEGVHVRVWRYFSNQRYAADAIADCAVQARAEMHRRIEAARAS